MDTGLDGRRGLVVGGSRGIGKAIAFELAREGVDLVLVARTPGPLADAAAEIADASRRKVTAMACDVTDRARVEATVDDAARELGGLHILVKTVNCIHPGLTRTEGVMEMLAGRAAKRGITPEELEAADYAEGRGNSIGRMVDAREIAHLAVFLCSDRSWAINGETIAADGGGSRSVYY